MRWWPPFGKRRPPDNVIAFPPGGRDYLPEGRYVPVDKRQQEPPRPARPHRPRTYEDALQEQMAARAGSHVFVHDGNGPVQMLDRVIHEIKHYGLQINGMAVILLEGNPNRPEVERMRYAFSGLSRLELVGLLNELIIRQTIDEPDGAA